jgi:hypothetical protein
MKINEWNLIKYKIIHYNKVNKLVLNNPTPFQELVLTWTTELATHILK